MWRHTRETNRADRLAADNMWQIPGRSGAGGIDLQGAGHRPPQGRCSWLSLWDGGKGQGVKPICSEQCPRQQGSQANTCGQGPRARRFKFLATGCLERAAGWLARQRDPMLFCGGATFASIQAQQPAAKMAGLCWADWNGNSMGVVITKQPSLSGTLWGA